MSENEKWEIKAKFEAIIVLVVFAFVFVYFGLMCEHEDLTGQNSTEIVKEETR